MSPAPEPTRYDRWWMVAIVVLTVVAYSPTIRAGPIWDDPDYITNNLTLRSVGGLWPMWTDRLALPQYYPLVHTTFWVQYQLHGLWWPGFHAINVALHIASALLLLRLLRTLRLPGAPAAALLFAVHPVMVESVAWVTERKNVLSLLLALMSLQAWLAWREQPTRVAPRRWSLVWFVLAMLSKSVVCVLPVVMFAVAWWRREPIDKRLLRGLAPFFLLGLLLAMNTAQIERTKVGANGPEWDYAPTVSGELAHRTLIAGRAVWFYPAKLIWPSDLRFIYPRWSISPDDAVAWLRPGAAALTLALLFSLRRRIGRGPFVAALLYAAALFPALGYFNVYPHRYSFVADHFQYHASVIFFSATVTVAARWNWRWWSPPMAIVLAALTFRYARVYHDATTLWTHVATRDPRSWIAWTNLGNELKAAGRMDEAGLMFERALVAREDVSDTQKNAGDLRMRQGRADAAERHYRRAIELDRRYVPAYVQLAALLRARGDVPSALSLLQQALDIAPTNPEANLAAGQVLEERGLLSDAAERYRFAAEGRPDDFEMQYNLGTVLLKLRRAGLAIAPLERATTLRPASWEAWANLAFAFAATGNRRAVEAARTAIERGAVGPSLERLLPLSRG